jgi:membrane associated rhomboid family serine protease
MPPARWLDRRFSLLGGSLTAASALLIGVTLVTSILGAQLPGLAGAGALVPGLVLTGQLWRMVTWVFFEQHPLGLVFAALAIYWFGNDLVRIWGPVRFLATYLGLAAAAAGVTCVVGLAWPAVYAHPFLGAWAVVSGMIVAWACAFPTRNILVYFVLPLSGKNLIYATLGGTLLFALFSSFGLFVPHFAAELLTLAAMRGRGLRNFWARVKFELAYRNWRRRTSRLREVPRPPRDETPRWYH